MPNWKGRPPRLTPGPGTRLPEHIREQFEAAGINPEELGFGAGPRRLRDAPPDNPYEDTEQRELFQRIDAICYHPQAAARWPSFRKVFAVPNGGKRDAALGRWLKEQGTRKGQWDVWAPVRRRNPAAPDGFYSGLILEVKRRKGTGGGTRHISRRANDDAPWWSQASWYAMLTDEGYLLVECHGGLAAFTTLAYYFGYYELSPEYDKILTGETFARLL